jgi:glycosyltransferase involved in cell wall biosynthesis
VKANVLQLIHSFIQGGSETQMIQLTKLLVNSGNFNIHVACLDGGGKLRPKIDELNVGPIPEFNLTSFYDRNMVTQSRRFAAYLREHDIKVVHTHEFYSNIFGMAGARLAGVPVRIASKRETLGLRSNAQKKLELLTFKMASAIVVNAEAVKNHLLGLRVNKTKPNVIYNGLDLDRFPTAFDPAETLRGLSPLLPTAINGTRPRFVTIVANMHLDVKNYPMFLRAAQRVHKSDPNAIFLMVGEGGLTDSLRELAKELGIQPNAIFLGHSNNVPDLLRVSDICVLSSKAEGFSNSILEYMACGKPVVATDVGGAREAIAEAETGYLVPSDDDKTMADRILQLLNDPANAEQMGARGRKIVEDSFSCDAQLRKTEHLYERLLSKSRA